MIAFVLKDFGGVENLIKTEVPLPVVRDNEVLVKVKAISINPVDIKTRLGKGQADRLKDFKPIILNFYLSIKTAATIPEGLIALGSAAVGGLAGLLAPSPMGR